MTKELQNFGGSWTQEKLQLLEKYLQAYSIIMNKRKYNFAYIDAFAGTGYFKETRNPNETALLEEFGYQEQKFLEGSTRIALNIRPSFQSYIFIEKDPKRYDELLKLKVEFPHLKDRIKPTNDEANKYLMKICGKDWSRHRAVVFLDPFGMEVKWNTIEAIAKTQAIDLWLLFPLGQAVNRLLRKDGEIDLKNKRRLDDLFGTDDWYDHFYQKHQEDTLFGQQTSIKKVANFKLISNYFIERLKTIFADVSKNPRALYNSKNVPLFLFCFAAGNKRGAPVAIKIANDILRKI